MSSPRISRRAFLRGAGGIAVPLPVLDVMLDANGAAFAAGAALPMRFLVCFGGFSLRADGDQSPNLYTPDTIGPGYDLKPALAPLSGFGKVNDAITVVSGLRIPTSGSKTSTPPGGIALADHFHFNPLLAGNRQIGDLDQAAVTGPTSDQVVADAVAGQTMIRSLVYRIQPSNYVSFTSASDGFTGAPNKSFLSHRKDAGGKIVPVVPAVSPKGAFDNLFINFKNPTANPQETAKKAFEIEKRKSLLDLVDRRMSGLVPRLGVADQRRLGQHFDEVRQLERRIAAMPPMDSGGACQRPGDPGADPPVGGGNPGYQYSVNNAYSNEDQRARAFCDLLQMAFTCDMTRAASLMFTTFQSMMNVDPLFPGYGTTVHGLTHKASTAKVADIIAWHMKHFGYLVSRLRDTPEGNGSVLDRSAIVFLHEHGFGGPNGFGTGNLGSVNAHNTENMAVVVAGRAGGLKAGHHIVAPAAANHPVNVLITAMNAVGVGASSLGEVAGSIPALVG